MKTNERQVDGERFFSSERFLSIGCILYVLLSFRIVVMTNKLSDIDLLVSVAWAVQAETDVCDTCSFIMAATFRNWYPRMHDLI